VASIGQDPPAAACLNQIVVDLKAWGLEVPTAATCKAFVQPPLPGLRVTHGESMSPVLLASIGTSGIAGSLVSKEGVVRVQIRWRISAKNFLDTAISAIWKITWRAWWITLATILTSFYRD